MADDADTHEKDVEELDERMQKLTHKLENARRDFVRSAASDAYAATPSPLGGDSESETRPLAGLREGAARARQNSRAPAREGT